MGGWRLFGSPPPLLCACVVVFEIGEVGTGGGGVIPEHERLRATLRADTWADAFGGN